MMLESALRTSALGINAHGQAISVVGDNIANANTTAFKASRAEFEDIMAEVPDDKVSETVTGGGDGVAIGRVRVIQDLGAIESTGRELDVGISGGGFFLVGNASAPQFSRSGAFEINTDGILVNSNGLPVLGYAGADTATLTALNMYDVKTAGAATTKSTVYGNLDASADITTVPANIASYNDLGKVQSYSANQDVYDSLGARHSIQLSFFKTANNTWTAQAYIDGGDVGGTAGTPVLLGQATMNFSPNGTLVDASKAQAVMTLNPAYSNGAAAGAFSIDLGSFSQYSGSSLLNNITQDGQSAGSVTSYEFDKDGKLYAVLDTGTRSQIGTIPLATVTNVDGLERSGSGTFSQTETSGEVQIGSPGSGLLGTLEGGALERSTVDIADQFVNLVIFQRGYQANSQVLGTTSQMVQNTLSLIR